MAIDFGQAIASFVGGGAQHLLNERVKERDRIAKLEDQKDLLDTRFGYEKILKEMDILSKEEIAKYKINETNKTSKKKVAVRFGADSTYLPDGFTGEIAGTDAKSRLFSKRTQIDRAMKPLVDAVNNKKISLEAAQDIIKKNGWDRELNDLWTTSYSVNMKDNDDGTKNPSYTPRVLFGSTHIFATPFFKEQEIAKYGSNFVEKRDRFDKIFPDRKYGNSFAQTETDASLGQFSSQIQSLYVNPDFIKLTKEYNTDEIDDEEYFAGTRALLKNSKNLTDNDIFNIITHSDAIKNSRRDAQGNPLTFNPIPEGGKTIRENIQRARNIQGGALNIIQLMIEEEPITTNMSSSLVKSGLDKLVGVKELFDFFDGAKITTAVQENRLGQIQSRLAAEIAKTDLTEAQQKDVLQSISNEVKNAELQLKKDPNNAQALASYKFAMEKLTLTFSFAKYIQGGAGGNAVSNADFMATQNALFGTFATNPAENRKLIAQVMRDLHSKMEDQVVENKKQLGIARVLDPNKPQYQSNIATGIYNKLLDDSTRRTRATSNIVEYYNQYRPKNMIELNDSNVDIFGNVIKKEEQIEVLLGNEDEGNLISDEDADALKPTS